MLNHNAIAPFWGRDEFTLEPTATGTRLTVVESGFAQLPDDAYRTAFEANTGGWAHELGELVEYLDANAA